MYSDRNFLIFPYSQLNLINFEEVLETSSETVRTNVNKTKVFVKWEGNDIPPSLSLLSNTEGPYNYTEMLAILQTSDWVADFNI